ncbi:hypothetical protein KIN20_004156 [Parelaphostrongylus tenuis]|uniref:Uncharacterized protein n=1 Tax=Parelaphostrongylus tenuis TaxID=148309 RepID=A0AAD5LYC9_PARTN|nr:hypothetical protein KIN20_004156 [Parelaphostrongylus tenuis]
MEIKCKMNLYSPLCYTLVMHTGSAVDHQLALLDKPRQKDQSTRKPLGKREKKDDVTLVRRGRLYVGKLPNADNNAVAWLTIMKSSVMK